MLLFFLDASHQLPMARFGFKTDRCLLSVMNAGDTHSAHQLGLERTQSAANLPPGHEWLHKYLLECSDTQYQQTVSSLKCASLRKAVM